MMLLLAARNSSNRVSVKVRRKRGETILNDKQKYGWRGPIRALAAIVRGLVVGQKARKTHCVADKESLWAECWENTLHSAETCFCSLRGSSAGGKFFFICKVRALMLVELRSPDVACMGDSIDNVSIDSFNRRGTGSAEVIYLDGGSCASQTWLTTTKLSTYYFDTLLPVVFPFTSRLN